LFSWLMVLGAIGAAWRLFRRPSPVLSYLADSSYWIYLMHMPVLGLIQGDLFLVRGHALWKAPLVLAGTLAVGFASYQSLVRHTALGAALHGRRAHPGPRRLTGRPLSPPRPRTPDEDGPSGGQRVVDALGSRARTAGDVTGPGTAGPR
jgi:hypothetical protein